MPITRGSGNPDWTRDETVLALDLLYRRGPLNRDHPEVLELSNLLRMANFVPTEKRKENFRNNHGVGLKLQNLMSALDSSRKLSASQTDRDIVAAYPRSKATELADVASRIRAAIQGPDEVSVERTGSHEEEEFVEGRIITAQHRFRDRRIRLKFLRQTADEQLSCAVCSFAPSPNLDRSLRESFFEAHHIVPLAADKGDRTTRLTDVALVCAGCHRFIHRLIVLTSSWVTIAEAREELRTGARSSAMMRDRSRAR